MKKTKKLQKDFYQSIFNKDHTEIAKHIRGNSIPAENRISIYRNTIKENLRGALALTFPAIWKLLGEECANGVANAFILNKENLPTTGCLDDWGGQFPLFLQSFEPLQDLDYISEVATIEWLKHSSYYAKDTLAFKAQKLQKFTTEELLNLQFTFNPSVFFYQANYALKPIFDLLENPELTITLENSISPMVIVRHEQHVQVLALEPQLYRFLILLKEKSTLEQAFCAQGADFDLTQALQFMLSYHMILKVKSKG